MRKGVHWNMSATNFATALFLFLLIFFLLANIVDFFFSSGAGNENWFILHFY